MGLLQVFRMNGIARVPRIPVDYAGAA